MRAANNNTPENEWGIYPSDLMIPKNTKWLVHVHGPGDLYEFDNYDEAKRLALEINSFSAKLNHKYPGNEVLNIAFITPQVPDGNPEFEPFGAARNKP